MNRNDIAAILDRCPTLTFAGMGLEDNVRGWTKDQVAEKWKAERAELLNSSDVCTKVCEWLSKIRPIKRLNRWHSSYGLKHFAEREIGEYVSNGQFIIAAIHCGYKYGEDGTLNVCFAMSEPSIIANSPKTRFVR
jgi:hypothetical protein